jgi:hypothetical protein
MLSQLRTLIKQADPEVVKEWKWRGVPGELSAAERGLYMTRHIELRMHR